MGRLQRFLRRVDSSRGATEPCVTLRSWRGAALALVPFAGSLDDGA